MSGGPAPLSNDDLGIFFEPHHHELAAHLETVAETLLAEEDKAHDLAYARNLAQRMGDELGLYRWLAPESGAPDVRALCLIREALGFASPLAVAIFAVQGLGSTPIRLAGTTEQRRQLEDVRRGRCVGAFALTEPGAGSDVAAIATRATPAGDSGDYVLDGEKTLISNIGIAHQAVVFANAAPALGRKGITAFLVPIDSPGLETAAIELSVDHPIGRMRFDGCRVPRTALLGKVGDGFRIAMETLGVFRVSVAAAAVGMARRALAEALGHVTRRVQFGKPLSAQQQVQTYLAESATELDAARLLTCRAAHDKDTAPARDSTVAVSMAKMFATEAAQRIIDRALQLHGGLGVVRGSVVERLYREIRPLRIYEGTTEIQRLIIAKGLTKRSDP